MNKGGARPRARAQTLRTRPGIEPGLGEPPRVVKASRATTPTVDADARANRSREGDVVCKLLPARVSRTRSCAAIIQSQITMHRSHVPQARPRTRSHWCSRANRPSVSIIGSFSMCTTHLRWVDSRLRRSTPSLRNSERAAAPLYHIVTELESAAEVRVAPHERLLLHGAGGCRAVL